MIYIFLIFTDTYCSNTKAFKNIQCFIICLSNFQVGLLDVDLCGPSIPYLLGLENQEVHQCEEGWVPIYLDQEQKLAVMSIGFLLKSRNDSVVWRGPKKTGKVHLNTLYDKLSLACT